MSMMSRMDKTKKHGQNHAKKEQHIGSIMDLRPQKISNKLTFKLQRTANEYAARGTGWAVLKLTGTLHSYDKNKQTKRQKQQRKENRSPIIDPRSLIPDPRFSILDPLSISNPNFLGNR